MDRAQRQARDQGIVALAQSGLSSGEIAELVGISRQTVWSKTQDVSGPRDRVWKQPDVDAKLLALYQSRCSDAEIRRQTGHSVETIRHWRKSRGLEVHSNVGGLQDKAAEICLTTGRSYQSVADELGLTRNVVAGAVHRAKLRGGSYQVPYLYEDRHRVDDARVRNLYELGKNDVQIANLEGVHKSTILKWRQRNGLPARQKGARRIPCWQLADVLRRQGLKYRDIAKILECSVASVGNFLRRAREEPGRQERKARS